MAFGFSLDVQHLLEQLYTDSFNPLSSLEGTLIFPLKMREPKHCEVELPRCSRSKVVEPVFKGTSINLAFMLSDPRLLEYD